MTELPDKRRDYVNDKRPVSFVLREAGFVPDFERVTSCAVVAFNEEGKLVTAYEHGGPDFPGGHVRIDEDTAEQTVRRESLEEAGIIISEPKHVRAIEARPEGAQPEEFTYMLIMTAMVTGHGEMLPGSQRAEMSVEEFKATYHGLDAAMTATLVDEAFAINFPE